MYSYSLFTAAVPPLIHECDYLSARLGTGLGKKVRQSKKSLFCCQPRKNIIILHVKPLRKQRVAGGGERQRDVTAGNTAEEFHVITRFTAPEALNYISEQLLSLWEF